MSELPVGMLIGYGVICLIFDSIHFDVKIALLLIVIESIYDVAMKRAKNCSEDGEKRPIFKWKKREKTKDKDEYNPFK